MRHARVSTGVPTTAVNNACLREEVTRCRAPAYTSHRCLDTLVPANLSKLYSWTIQRGFAI